MQKSLSGSDVSDSSTSVSNANKSVSADDVWHYANGKIILFGEHAVVYGVEAVAAAIPRAVRAKASPATSVSRLSIPAWSIEYVLDTAFSCDSENQLIVRIYEQILSELDLKSAYFDVVIEPNVPPASGLGASAALAVAATKALASCAGINIDNEKINQIAYLCEQLAHGTPSGLDNTLATYGGVLRFKRNDKGMFFDDIQLKVPVELLVVNSGKKGLTAEAVGRVRRARELEPERYHEIFENISTIVRKGISTLEAGDVAALGSLFDQNQQYLRDITVSCDEIEQVLTIAHSSGATGGKLTGSGDGGAVIIEPGSDIDRVERDINAAGFLSIRVVVGASLR